MTWPFSLRREHELLQALRERDEARGEVWALERANGNSDIRTGVIEYDDDGKVRTQPDSKEPVEGRHAREKGMAEEFAQEAIDAEAGRDRVWALLRAFAEFVSAAWDEDADAGLSLPDGERSVLAIACDAAGVLGRGDRDIDGLLPDAGISEVADRLLAALNEATSQPSESAVKEGERTDD